MTALVVVVILAAVVTLVLAARVVAEAILERDWNRQPWPELDEWVADAGE